MNKPLLDQASKKDWVSLARSLDTRLSGWSFHAKAIDALESSCGQIGIGCSGGADSLFLLLLIWERFPGLRERMVVLHFNHDLRGEESEGDEVFVRNMAESLGLGFQSRRASERRERISEEILRNQRLAFFRKSGCAVILQGHHGDDVLETLLMRICRGSGTEGLAAPRPVHRHRDGITFIRPLLNLERMEIRESLEVAQINWREDHSNAGRDFFRNRIRHDVIPGLKSESGHNPVSGALRSRTLLEEDTEALEVISESICPRITLEPIDMSVFFSQPRAILRRIAQRWLSGQNGVNLSASAFDRLIDHIEGGEPITQAAGAGFVEFDGASLSHQAGATSAVDWPTIRQIPNTWVFIPGRYAIRVTLIDLTVEHIAAIQAGNVDVRKEAFLAQGGNIPSEVFLRKWQDGDRYMPLGAPGSKKLQDLFTDAKLPRMERRRIPLVCLGAEKIAWIPGFPPADSFKIINTTKQALWLTCDYT